MNHKYCEVAMKHHWAMEFFHLAKSSGANCMIHKMANGWVETICFGDKHCFTKSATYNHSRNQYFQAVDPHKLNEIGDFVLICGGTKGSLSDIFMIPWDVFFNTLKGGEPLNTFKLPKKYFQYKFYLRNREDRWLMSVQGGSRPVLGVSSFHHSVDRAIKLLNAM